MKHYPAFRCSALPRITSCPASAKTPDVVIDSSGDVASIGTTAHELYAQMVRRGTISENDIRNIATRDGVDCDELAMLVFSGLREWKKVESRILYTCIETNRVLPVRENGELVLTLTGKTDLAGRLIVDPSTGIILDWKTGYRDATATAQMMGYALIDYRMSELVNDQAPERYIMMAVYTRLGITETTEVPSDELLAFERELVRIAKDSNPTYSPSQTNCEYCRCAPECPARRKMIESASRDIMAMTGDSVNKITPSVIAELYPQSRVLKKALENFESMLRDAVVAAGGSIAFDGGEITLKETTRRNIEWRPDILRSYLTDHELSELRPTISKTDLERAVSAAAPSGKKKQAKDDCIADLKEAGAIEETVSKSLEYRKVS